MIIDTHCHFDMMNNPETFIRQTEINKDIVIGMTNLPTHFDIGYPHIKSCKYVRLALGLHPLLAAENKKEVSYFMKFIDQTSYIGEIGLDFSKDGIATKQAQINVLKDLLGVLEGKKKIISVHSRKAERQLFEILCEYNIENVIFHWYSGPIKLIPEIVSRGYYFSVNEAMTISNNGQSIIKNIPIDRILTETDAPFNSRCNIRNALVNMNITEDIIRKNFMSLIAKMR